MKPHLLLCAALCAAPLTVRAEAPATLDTLVTIGTRSDQVQNRLPAPVTVITREQIDRSGASHVAEVLRLAGALQVTELYGDGSAASVDLRGFGDAAHSNVLVLLDGRRLNNPDIAPPDLNSIALRDVQRIEIIQGSAGVLYGDQAVGGVINIVTIEPRRFAASLAAQGGSYGALGGRGAVEQRWDALSMRLSAEARGSDNYRDHNAAEVHNALLRLGAETARGGVSVEVGRIEQDLETPGALFAADVEQDRRQSLPVFQGDFSDTDNSFVRVDFDVALAEGWQVRSDLDHRRTNGRFRLSFASFPAPSDSFQRRDVRAAHPRLLGTVAAPWGDAVLTTGIDAVISDYELVSFLGTQDIDQKQADLYSQAVVPLPASLELTAGARWARVDNQIQDTFTFTTPARFHDDRTAAEVGLAWRPLRPLRLFTRYDRSFRFAKVDELTSAGAPGAVNLSTQTGDACELGAELDLAGVALRLSAYRLQQQNEIAFDPTTFTNVNLDRTRRDGVIAELDLPLGLLAAGLRYHALSSEIRGGSLSGRDVPLAAPQTGKVWLDVALPAGFGTHVEVVAVDDRPFAGDFDNSLERLPGYAVLNAALQWRRGGLTLGVRGNNLLDHEYSEYGASGFDAFFTEQPTYFPSPEVNLLATAGYDW